MWNTCIILYWCRISYHTAALTASEKFQAVITTVQNMSTYASYRNQILSKNTLTRYRVSVGLKLLFQECRELDQSQSWTSYAPPDPCWVNFSGNARHGFDVFRTGTKATGLNAIDRLHADTYRHQHHSLKKLHSRSKQVKKLNSQTIHVRIINFRIIIVSLKNAHM